MPGLYEKWMSIAMTEIGQKEIPGAGNNERIMEYFKSTAYKASGDLDPWCSAFACWVLGKAGIGHPNSAWSRSFLGWGVGLDKPVYGCVAVLERGANSGHVAFYVKSDLLFVYLLGGNQSNQVCIQKYPKYKVLGYRWPKDS